MFHLRVFYPPRLAPYQDAGSSLRWLSASNMTLWHHFDSTSDPEPHNLSLVVWVKLFKAATLCLWTKDQCAQTLYMLYMNAGSSLRWLSASTMMFDIILTPQKWPTSKDANTYLHTVYSMCCVEFLRVIITTSLIDLSYLLLRHIMGISAHIWGSR